MIKKLISFITLLLVLSFPISAFADSTNVNIGTETSVVQDSSGTNGSFSGTDLSSSDSLVTPQASYWAVMYVKAAVIGTSTVEANFNVSANDYIYSMALNAELQRYEDGDWLTVSSKYQSFIVNPSSKTPKGQFNFYNVTVPGNYRVEIYGTMEARNTCFSLITDSPTSNTVTVGGIIV